MSVEEQTACRATAGSIDKNILITELQTALSDEITEAKKQSFSKKTELFDGQRIYSSNALHVYRFSSDNADDWRNRKQYTQVTVSIEDEDVLGHLDSADKKTITIALEADKGELIEEATLQDNAIFLLESLYNKLERTKNGSSPSNIDGSLKLFGLKPVSSFAPFISFSASNYPDLNFEQQIAVLKSLSQEVTFIWGPPGTGKTQTLTSLIALLIQAGKKVLIATNTNAALDQILQKFIDKQQNDSFVTGGAILRLGVPTFEHEKLDYLLPDKRVEKKDPQSEDKAKAIEESIQRILKRKQELETEEKELIQKIKQQAEAKRELELTIQEIANANRQLMEHEKKQENNGKTARYYWELLEKNQRSNFISRAFSSVNKQELEHQLKLLNNERQITSIEILSTKKKLEEAKCKKELLENKLSEPTVYDSSSTEYLTQEKIKQAIEDITREEKQKNEELNNWRKSQSKIGVMNEALVIGATIARASIDPYIPQIKFDTLILDEASMAILPSVFFLAGLCSSNCVISGDFRQLSPIAESNTPIAQKWLRRDIFAQAGIVDSVDSSRTDDRLVMLREQYRMHPTICNLISDIVYDGKLKTPESIIPIKQKITSLPPFEDKALIFCDTATTDPFIARPKNSYSRLSPYSAVISSAIALKCVKEGAKRGLPISVGIVTPYRAQAGLISRILEDYDADANLIIASTIHRFQGSERDCIIFDLVEGKPLPPGKLTQGPFKKSEPGRLINVAISRARGKFILIGNSEYISKNFNASDAMPQLLEQIEQNGQIVDSNITGYWPYEGNNAFEGSSAFKDASFTIFDETNFYQALLEDMSRAKSKIVIFSPFVSKKRVELLLADFQKICQKGVPIYIITRKKNSRDAVDDLKKIGVNVIFASNNFGLGESFDKFHFKIAAVDNFVVYYGSLNILAQFESSESMMAFRSKRTVSQLIRNFGIDRIIKDYLASSDYRARQDVPLLNSSAKSYHTLKLDSLPPADEAIKKTELSVKENAKESYQDYVFKEFGKIQASKTVTARDLAKARLRQLGVKLGFDCFVDYGIDNLLKDALTRCISVVWMKGKEIEVAFQVIETEWDVKPERKMVERQKIELLQANEKYFIEVSSLSGSITITRIANPANITANVTKVNKGTTFVETNRTRQPFDLNKIRVKYARAYESWFDSEDKQLIDEYNQGLKPYAIAKIHQRQRSAIKSRIRRLRKLQLIT